MMSRSDLPVNEVGGKQLHDLHTIELEESDTKFARARVRDQLFIDHLLLKDILTLDQHATAERLLNLAVSAAVYLKSPSMAGFVGSVSGASGGGRKDIYSSRLMKWHRAEKSIRSKWGDDGVGVVHDHIILDVWTDNPVRIDFLSQILGKKKGEPKPPLAKVESRKTKDENLR